MLLSNVGRPHEALSFQLVAHATDEWGPPKTAKLALAYANMGNLPAARAWVQKGIQLWPNHSGVRRAQRYIAGFYERPSDALAIFDRMDAQSSPDRNNAVWQSFIEARSARSPGATVATIRGIREAADQNKISRENEVMMLAALGETKAGMEAANFALDHINNWSRGSCSLRSLEACGRIPALSHLQLAWASSNIGVRRANCPTSAPAPLPEANAAPNFWRR